MKRSRSAATAPRTCPLLSTAIAGAICLVLALPADAQASRHLYVTNFDASANTISAFGVQADGARLYTVNGSSNDASAFSIESGGSLTSVPGSPFSGVVVPNFQSAVATPNERPTASFSAVPAPANQATSFDASASSDPDGQITRYDWDFGDGGTASDGAATTSHAYANAGDYTLYAKATDTAGNPSSPAKVSFRLI